MALRQVGGMREELRRWMASPDRFQAVIDAYNKGRDAFAACTDANPYNPGTVGFHAWELGWEDASIGRDIERGGFYVEGMGMGW